MMPTSTNTYPERSDTAQPDAALCRGVAAADAACAEQGILSIYADQSLIVRCIAGLRTLAAAADEAIDKPLLDLLPELEPHALQVSEMLAGHMDRLDLGLVRRASAHGERIVWMRAAPRVADAQVVGIVATLQEATLLGERLERFERQRREIFDLRQVQARLNMELALAQAEVRRLDEAKSQFVSAAAHELRNPLASLMGYIELLDLEDSSYLNDAQRQYIAGVGRSAMRLKTLTNNLLDISRLDSNRLELVMNTLDPLLLLENAVSEMQPLFDLKKQRVVLRAESSVPLIWCDRVRAMQILTNLLSNAQKYTPQGGSVTVSVSHVRNRPFVQYRVKDTGIGIPPEEHYHLFSRFYRASNAGAADGSGAGLGLAITQSLVKLHGGKIWFESKQGKGTTFFVTFPIAT
jgi:signal transduction histidine kinase